MRRFFSSSAENIRKMLLRKEIRDLEKEILRSRYKYRIKPFLYDGTEQQLLAEVERLKKEISKYAVTTVSDVGIPPEWKLR